MSFDTFVAPPVPVLTSDPALGQSDAAWSPITATLISGEHDAVVVDPLMTIQQGHALADWIAATGKRLTTVYITHGHGDHWFGLGVLRQRFPDVRALATPRVVERMRQQIEPNAFAAFWKPWFADQVQEDVAVAEPLVDSRIDLEGTALIPLEVGHTDTDDTTVLHVPSIGLIVAGDVAYNDVHLYLAESDTDKRKAWIRALEALEALRPQAVVAGHKRADRQDHPRILEETRQYIRDFDRIAETASSSRELYERMLALYPNRINPGALALSARSVKAASA